MTRSDPAEARDKKYMEVLAAVQVRTEQALTNAGVTFGSYFADRARQFGDRPFVQFGHETYTYKQVEDYSNQIANWGISAGLEAGDRIALVMGNSVDYVAVLIAMSKIGVGSALVNPGLTGEGLEHSLRLAQPKVCLVDHASKAAVSSISPVVTGRVVEYLDTMVMEFDQRLSAPDVIADSASDFCFIYTSGTTGHPKSARFDNARIIRGGVGVAEVLHLRPGDNYYVCLPLFHASALICGMAACVESGAQMLLRRKFSASRFWEDCSENRATHFLYIGDLCKFLLSRHPEGIARPHSIRTCFGNGMQEAVWREFQGRFSIPEIVEFYGATEASLTIFNLENEPGIVGYIPPAMQEAMGGVLVRYDLEAGDVVRDREGFCIRCGQEEAGEFITRIATPQQSEIYTEVSESQKKILRNVFEAGDAWFRTGDLLRMDEQSRYRFVDRLGDTFRWRGENVATCDVEDCLRGVPGVEEVAVYGVEIPGEPGRAGMAAIVAGDSFSVTDLYGLLSGQLPKHAVPRFIRIVHEIPKTGTYKPIKHLLKQRGYQVLNTEGPVFFAKEGKYVPLTEKDCALIEQSEMLIL